MITASVKQQTALDTSSRGGTSDSTGLAISGLNFIREGYVLTTVYPELIVSNGPSGFHRRTSMAGDLGGSTPRAGARGAPPRFRGRLGDCTRGGGDVLGIDVLVRGRLVGLEVAEAIVVGLGIDVQVGLLGLPRGFGRGQLGNGCRGRVGGMPGHAPGRTLASTGGGGRSGRQRRLDSQQLGFRNRHIARMHGDSIRLVSIGRLSPGDGDRRIATSPRTVAASEQGNRSTSDRRIQGHQAVAVEQAVDRAGSRVQTMIAARLGEVAHSGNVAVGGEQPSSGPSLLGAVIHSMAW